MKVKKGLVIYKSEDANHNKSYIEWLIDEGKRHNMCIQYFSYESWLSSGLMALSNEKLDFVINRTREASLGLQLELCDLPVFNNSEITRLGNDKLEGYLYAKKQGFPILPIGIRGQLNRKHYILKPVDGHGGRGIKAIEKEDFSGAFCSEGKVNEIDWQKTFLQERSTEIVGDLRCYVIGNEIRHVVLRHLSEDGLLCNFSKGAEITYVSLPQTIRDKIKAFIKPLNIDYAGVDFLVDKQNQYYFNEFEDVVGSRMLSELGKNDTTEVYLRHICNNC